MSLGDLQRSISFFTPTASSWRKKEGAIFHETKDVEERNFRVFLIVPSVCLQPPNCSMMQLIYSVTLWAAAKMYLSNAARSQRISLRVSASSRERKTLDLIRLSRYKSMDFYREVGMEIHFARDQACNYSRSVLGSFPDCRHAPQRSRRSRNRSPRNTELTINSNEKRVFFLVSGKVPDGRAINK